MAVPRLRYIGEMAHLSPLSPEDLPCVASSLPVRVLVSCTGPLSFPILPSSSFFSCRSRTLIGSHCSSKYSITKLVIKGSSSSDSPLLKSPYPSLGCKCSSAPAFTLFRRKGSQTCPRRSVKGGAFYGTQIYVCGHKTVKA